MDATTAPDRAEAIEIEDPPTAPAYITALSDAYVVPRDDRFAVYWRTAKRDLCTVDREVAERALRGDGEVVRLGTWSGTYRSRTDEWTVWWARGVPWVATSDVLDREQMAELIERWRTASARAEARGRRWDPAPPPNPRPAPPPRRALLGRLRALFQER